MTDEAIQAPQSIEELKIGTPVSGEITELTIYGAMVNIGLSQDAMLHISQLDKDDFRNVEDVLNKGDQLEAFVLKVNRDKERVALTMVKPPEVPWETIRVENTYQGTVTRIERFGAFVDIGAERPGMVHVSEMTDGYVQSPSDVVSVGDTVEVRVIKVDRRKRQIDLSMRTPVEEVAEAMEPDEEPPTAMAVALRKAMQSAKRSNRRRRNN